MADVLFPTYTVGCFTCPHTVRDTTPDAAHDLMERHYTEKHAALIARVTAQVTTR